MKDNKEMSDADRMIALELATNELADENAKLKQRIFNLELRPQPCPIPQPYPVYPGWIPQPGVIPGTPWHVPPDAKFMGMYYTTKEGR